LKDDSREENSKDIALCWVTDGTPFGLDALDDATPTSIGLLQTENFRSLIQYLTSSDPTGGSHVVGRSIIQRHI
jgi:hypothetical protein